MSSEVGFLPANPLSARAFLSNRSYERQRSMDVVFLGAGASKAMGYPLTSELLPRIVAKLQSGSLFGRLTDAERKRDRLKKALDALAPGWVHNRLPTFVDLLSLLDYCIHQNVTIFPSGGHFELRSFRAIIEAALVEVSSPDRSDRLLADTFRTRLKDHPSVAFITTNYDLACEVTLVSLLGHLAATCFTWGCELACSLPMIGRTKLPFGV